MPVKKKNKIYYSIEESAKYLGLSVNGFRSVLSSNHLYKDLKVLSGKSLGIEDDTVSQWQFLSFKELERVKLLKDGLFHEKK